ncbi:MAG TPA: endolytic transglycosylase MltG [Caulobacteraceae bacterium]
MSRRPRRISRPRGKGRGRAALVVLVALALVAGWAVLSYAGPGPRAPGGRDTTTVFLPRGASLPQIAARLDAAGVIDSRLLFVTATRVSGRAGTLKAGEYQFASEASMRRVLAKIVAGRVVRHQITVPEGYTSGMVVDLLAAEPALSGPVISPPEGSILPETYDFHRGESRAEVIARMRQAQTDLLDQLWPNRAADLPFDTREEAVILASIVEKETGVPAERPRIAAVFVNRLKKGMRLESDPTIIYGVTKGRPLGRSILLSEKNSVTPWNTYTKDGLPETPIANPGRAALEAVLNPPKTDELFFVADGTGGHVFSSTFEEHERNVARWRRIKAAQMKAGVR